MDNKDDEDLEELPPFDPTALCIKCGWSIPDPVAPEPKMGPKNPDGSQQALPAAAPPPPTPPTVQYCNGEQCPWDEGDTEAAPCDEHMHQFCDVCGYEWLSAPLSTIAHPMAVPRMEQHKAQPPATLPSVPARPKPPAKKKA